MSRSKAARERGLSDAATIFLVGAGVVLALIGIGLVIYLVVYATADVRGRVAVHNKVHGADYRMPAYEHFFDLCNSVVAREQAIDNIRNQLPLASDARKQQLEEDILANQNERANLITSYNADAAKTATQGQFRDSHLPYHLDVTQEATQCNV